MLSCCNPCMRSLILWESPAHSGIAFGSVLVLLLAIKYVSCLAVLGNGALALLTATMAFRIYKSVLSAVNKTDDGHPFKAYLAMDVSIREEQAYELFSNFLHQVNNTINKLKELFFIVSVVESLKFAAVLYLMSYLGRMMNGLTLLVWLWIAFFSLPKVYADNQRAIDDALAPILLKLKEMRAMLAGGTQETKKDQ